MDDIAHLIETSDSSLLVTSLALRPEAAIVGALKLARWPTLTRATVALSILSRSDFIVDLFKCFKRDHLHTFQLTPIARSVLLAMIKGAHRWRFLLSLPRVDERLLFGRSVCLRVLELFGRTVVCIAHFLFPFSQLLRRRGPTVAG